MPLHHPYGSTPIGTDNDKLLLSSFGSGQCIFQQTLFQTFDDSVLRLDLGVLVGSFLNLSVHITCQVVDCRNRQGNRLTKHEVLHASSSRVNAYND
jgi:hypothetical protein